MTPVQVTFAKENENTTKGAKQNPYARLEKLSSECGIGLCGFQVVLSVDLDAEIRLLASDAEVRLLRSAKSKISETIVFSFGVSNLIPARVQIELQARHDLQRGHSAGYLDCTNLHQEQLSN